MKPLEAEKLLGGHAAGILSEAERRALFEAALEHQELFDALADQEVLRELLADPASRAQLLAALAPAKRSVPLWRHPALLGAAASLLVAATAGLAYLRSPQSLAPRLDPEQEGRAGPGPPAATPPPWAPRPAGGGPPPRACPTPAPPSRWRRAGSRLCARKRPPRRIFRQARRQLPSPRPQGRNACRS